jgi:phenylpropionate dioxygenase-like ring-hydroxylating dioxygenase large terminal subunit
MEIEMQTAIEGGAAPIGNAPDLRRIGLHPDFWYPLAKSADVKPGETHLAMFAGEPIVLARSDRGVVFALDDRCAHRQFPLHKGVVAGDLLKCAYHAWCYQQDGCVAGVPYLPKGAARPKGVRSYACREERGYVFVFTGDRDRATEVPFPQFPALDPKRRRTMHFWRKVACHYSFMHENLMDMNHQFLHRGIMGTIRPTLLDHQSGPDWAEVRYRFRRGSGGSKPDRGAGMMVVGGLRRNGDGNGNGDGTSSEPAGDIMTIRTQYPYQTLSLRRSGAEHAAFDLWVAYVPYDREQRTHVSVGMLMIEKPRVPGLIHVFWPLIRRFTESVFTEDRMAVEAEQRAYDVQQGDWNQEINPVILALRQVLIRNGVPLPARPRPAPPAP